jgi:hypothetical protein
VTEKQDECFCHNESAMVIVAVVPQVYILVKSYPATHLKSIYFIVHNSA